MKRCLNYVATAMVGVGGLFVILCGMLFLSSAPTGPSRSNWWRVISGGMIMMGIHAVLNRKSIPDYVPEWVQRYFVPIYTLLWFIGGGIMFLLSWF